MVDTRRSRARVLARLVAVASTLLALGAGAHVIGHGVLPSGTVLGALAALTFAVATVLAQWRLRASTLLPAAALWQLFLHAAFAGMAIPGSGVVDAGHLAHGHSGAGLMTPSTGAMPGMPEHAMSSRMLAAHLVATAVTVALLIATERGVERGIERLALVLPALLGFVVSPVLSTRVGDVVHRAPRRLVSGWCVSAQGSRGPPAWVPAA